MLPTFPLRDMLLVDKFGPVILRRSYQNGDIVLSRAPYDQGKLVCKRIAAVEGEVIPHQGVSTPATARIASGIVPPGHVWLLGDNLEQSTDSRSYGPGLNKCSSPWVY